MDTSKPPKKRIKAIDAIKRHYNNKRWVLSEQQQGVHERLVAAFALIRKGYSLDKRTKLHMAAHGIDRAQAWRDFRNALELFGDVQKMEKEGMRLVLYGFALEAFNMAKKEKSHGGMTKAVEVMTKLLGLDRETPDLPAFDKLEAGHILVAIPAEIEDALRAMLGGGVVNFSKLRAPEPVPVQNIEEAQIEHD